MRIRSFVDYSDENLNPMIICVVEATRRFMAPIQFSPVQFKKSLCEPDEKDAWAQGASELRNRNRSEEIVHKITAVHQKHSRKSFKIIQSQLDTEY